MSSLKRRIGISLVSFGFDPRRTLRSLRFLVGYWRDLAQWRRLASPLERSQFALRLMPTLSDKHDASGIASGHYFHQDLWAARQIHRAAPVRHLDVGSRIDGFVAHLLCFREVEVLDIRSLESDVGGLRFRQADLMSDGALNVEAAESVSCLHALEHFGLGRYGDPIRPAGWRTGLRNLARLVLPGGQLYLGVPIGRAAVEFNAQRIFDPGHIVAEAALHGLRLRAFDYVDDAGRLQAGNVAAVVPDAPWASRLEYGCGLFLFDKQPGLGTVH